MPLKPVYTIDGRRWLPVARAAALLVTDAPRIKRLMGDGTLDWVQLGTARAIAGPIEGHEFDEP